MGGDRGGNREPCNGTILVSFSQITLRMMSLHCTSTFPLYIYGRIKLKHVFKKKGQRGMSFVGTVTQRPMSEQDAIKHLIKIINTLGFNLKIQCYTNKKSTVLHYKSNELGPITLQYCLTLY